MKALIGFHDPRNIRAISRNLIGRGYEVSTATNLEEMTGLIDPVPQFQLYIMDTNLSQLGAITTEPAQGIYALVKEQVESGAVKFMSVTGRHELFNDENSPVPIMNKMDLIDYLNEL